MATEDELFAVLERPRFKDKIAPEFLDRVKRILAAAEPVAITERISLCRSGGR